MTNPQSKYRTLIAIIVFLLVTNIAVLAYFMMNKKSGKHEKGRSGFENVLQREVGFNEQQVAEFKELKATHWATARQQMEELKQVKLNLFRLTREENTPDSVIKAKADSIANLQKQIELNSFQHFKATRKICTPEQKPAYDSLMKRIIARMGRSGTRTPEKDKK